MEMEKKRKEEKRKKKGKPESFEHRQGKKGDY